MYFLSLFPQGNKDFFVEVHDYEKTSRQTMAGLTSQPPIHPILKLKEFVL